MIVASGSLRTVAIDTRPRRWRAEARPAGDLDAACLELLRQGPAAKALRVAEMAATRPLVEPERQRGRQGDVHVREVVAPAGCPPVAREGSRRTEDAPADPVDAGVDEGSREIGHVVGVDLRVAVADDPQVPVEHIVGSHALGGEQPVGIVVPPPIRFSSAIDSSSFSLEAGGRRTQSWCR